MLKKSVLSVVFLAGLVLGASTIIVHAETIAQWLSNGVPISSGPITPTVGMMGVGNGTSFTYTATPAHTGAVTTWTESGAPHALTTSDYFVKVSGTSAWTLTLPAAASNAGRVYIIKRTDANAAANGSTNLITIDPNASETIDGALTTALVSAYSYIAIQCDGSNWFSLGAYDYITSSQFTPTNVPTSTQWGSASTDATTDILPAGAWAMTVHARLTLNGATAVSFPAIAIGTATGNSTTGIISGDNDAYTTNPLANNPITIDVPNWRTVTTASTQYYFKCNVTYSTASPQYIVRMTAVRSR